MIAVGRMGPETGERILREGKADLIAMGRRLIADPDLPNKAAEGQLDEINPCMGCFECLERRGVFSQQGVMCTINPVMGKELEYQIQPVRRVKRVVVVCGGPAGMEAVIVVAQRGHHVSLFEKESRLGGQLNVAGLPPYKGDIALWVDYLVRQVEKADVEVRLSTEATPETIIESQPDAVIIATGGILIVPDIPGDDSTEVVTAQDVLSGKAKVGQNVVVIGGGMVGCETGHYLAEKGKKVTITEILKRMANDMTPMVRRRLVDGLRAKQVSLLTEVTCEEIKAGSVIVATSEGQRDSIPADTVILAVGYQPNDKLLKELEGKVAEVHCIGDSLEPRRIMEAVSEGYRVGFSL